MKDINLSLNTQRQNVEILKSLTIKEVNMFKAEWTEKAIDELNKLETTISSRIIKKIDKLLINPYSINIKRLKGIDAFRLRVGDYRVIFEVNSNIILILKVGHRKNIYKD